MKVEIENLNGHFKKLTVEIPAEDVSKKLESHFKKIQGQATIKGFRKGKAPMNMIRESYAQQEMPRITQDLVNEFLNKAIIDQKLSPVANPQINLDSGIIDGASLKFTAEFENLPPIELKEYESFKAEKQEFKAEESDIQDTLNRIQQQMTTLKKADENLAIDAGLVAKMDYVGTEAGEKLSSASQDDAFVEIGNGQLVEGFETAVKGLKAGDEKEFDVKFPEKQEGSDEPHPLGGKTIHFKVKIKEVHEKEVPAIDDEFAKKAGPFENLDQLKEAVSKEVVGQKEQKFKQEIQEKAIEWLIQKNPIDAPETLVNQQIQNLAIEAGMQLQNMGLAQDQIETRLKEWEKEMTERANNQVKSSLLLGAIAKEQKIQVGDEDIRKELGRMASQTRKDPQEIVKDMQDKNMIPGFMRQVQEMKALEWILEKAMS